MALFCPFNINASHSKCFLLISLFCFYHNEFPIRISASIFQLNLAWNHSQKKCHFRFIGTDLVWFGLHRVDFDLKCETDLIIILTVYNNNLISICYVIINVQVHFARCFCCFFYLMADVVFHWIHHNSHKWWRQKPKMKTNKKKHKCNKTLISKTFINIYNEYPNAIVIWLSNRYIYGFCCKTWLYFHLDKVICFL